MNLDIDVVFINIKNAIEIANIFISLGIKNVFTYQEDSILSGKKSESSASKIQWSSMICN